MSSRWFHLTTNMSTQWAIGRSPFMTWNWSTISMAVVVSFFLFTVFRTIQTSLSCFFIKMFSPLFFPHLGSLCQWRNSQPSCLLQMYLSCRLRRNSLWPKGRCLIPMEPNLQPSGCGKTLTATASYQSETFTYGNLTAVDLRDVYSTCNYWITVNRSF